MTSGDADDSGESSPPTSMSTMSVAPLSAGVDKALSGAASSGGAESYSRLCDVVLVHSISGPWNVPLGRGGTT